MHLVETSFYVLIGIFALGYFFIIFEHPFKINKTAVSLLVAVACWVLYFLVTDEPLPAALGHLDLHISKAAQIIFFFMGSMTLVELIDSHQGFKQITDLIYTSSKKKMLWMVAILAFFLSAIIDNLTATILMCALFRKLIPHHEDRIVPGCLTVIAANAGGAWTPIGDITTTMLWIDGKLSTLGVMKALFVPSLVSVLVPLIFLSFTEKGRLIGKREEKTEVAPGGHLVLYIGVLAFVFVPIFHTLTHLPPFMGMLVALGILWIVTDILHYKYETRRYLRMPFIFTKIDMTSVLFFLGILLAMNALETAGVLTRFAAYLNTIVHSEMALVTWLGFASSIIDNVPLVAATMGMYGEHPIDASLWHMIAYAAGTGGSLLIIGSSAGIALMGMERVSFFAYLKKATFPALLGFLAGLGAYLLIS